MHKKIGIYSRFNIFELREQYLLVKAEAVHGDMDPLVRDDTLAVDVVHDVGSVVEAERDTSACDGPVLDDNTSAAVLGTGQAENQSAFAFEEGSSGDAVASCGDVKREVAIVFWFPCFLVESIV